MPDTPDEINDQNDVMGDVLPFGNSENQTYHHDVMGKGIPFLTVDEVKAAIALAEEEKRNSPKDASREEMKSLAVFYPTEFAIFKDFDMSILRRSPRPWQSSKQDIINFAKQRVIENRERFSRRFAFTFNNLLDQKIKCRNGELILTIENGYLCLIDTEKNQVIELSSGPKIPKDKPN